MFRRLASGLPPDPVYAADFEVLKYFINEKDQVRKLAHLEERFQFKITDHERYNEVHKEAFHRCLRREIRKRMIDLGLPPLYLPQLTYRKPKETPCLPIFLTRQVELRTKKRVIVIVNDHNADLGVWAWRVVCGEGFDAGCCTGLARELKVRRENGEEAPGLIILNPGQYYYSYHQNRALTHDSWMALPRKSLFHPPIKVDETHNLVPLNRTLAEHIEFVFENIVDDEAWVSSDADIYIVGVCEGGNGAIQYLAKEWSTKWASRVKAATWTHPFANRSMLDAHPAFETFLETRSLAWTVSPLPLGTCRGVPSSSEKESTPTPPVKNWEDEEVNPLGEYFLCPTFSAGEENFSECVFPKSRQSMLDFFEKVHKDGDGYTNPQFEVVVEAVGERELDDEGMPELLGDGIKTLSIEEVDREGLLAPPHPGADTASEVHSARGTTGVGDETLSTAGVSMDKDVLAKAGFLD